MAISRKEWMNMHPDQQWEMMQQLSNTVETGELLHDDEREIIGLLGNCFNKFSQLDVLHHADVPEFTKAIHAAQNIVLARAGLRATGVYRP